MESQCNKCLENDKSVFSVLNGNERAILKKNYRCKQVKKGEAIFREGDIPAGLISLSSGKVKIFKEGVNGREQIFRLASPVGFIGYRALFAEEVHTANAVALEDSVICIIDKKSLYKVMEINPSLTMRIIKSFATELGFSINRTVTLTQKHIRGRLAEALIFLINTYGFDEDSQIIKAQLSREDLANLSNMTTANAIRTLSGLAHEQIIELRGREIRVLKLYELEEISMLG